MANQNLSYYLLFLSLFYLIGLKLIFAKLAGAQKAYLPKPSNLDDLKSMELFPHPHDVDN